MKLIINNPGSDILSYASGTVTVPAYGSLDVPSGLWIKLYLDIEFIKDIRNSNLIIEDGITVYRYPESEIFIKDLLSRIDFYTSYINKDFSFSTSQTNSVIWTPESGKKFVITDYSINIRNSTLGAITVTIFDDVNNPGNILYKVNVESGANYDVVYNSKTPFESKGINRSLKITTSGNLTISGTMQGYETD